MITIVKEYYFSCWPTLYGAISKTVEYLKFHSRHGGTIFVNLRHFETGYHHLLLRVRHRSRAQRQRQHKHHRQPLARKPGTWFPHDLYLSLQHVVLASYIPPFLLKRLNGCRFPPSSRHPCRYGPEHRGKSQGRGGGSFPKNAQKARLTRSREKPRFCERKRRRKGRRYPARLSEDSSLVQHGCLPPSAHSVHSFFRHRFGRTVKNPLILYMIYSIFYNIFINIILSYIVINCRYSHYFIIILNILFIFIDRK